MFERVEDEEDLAEYDDLPMERQFSSKKAVAIKCREHLAILRDLTYVCTDIEVLNSMEDKLGLLVKTTKLRMQDEVGLIGDAAVSGPSKRKRKRPHQCGESKSYPFGFAVLQNGKDMFALVWSPSPPERLVCFQMHYVNQMFEKMFGCLLVQFVRIIMLIKCMFMVFSVEELIAAIIVLLSNQELRRHLSEQVVNEVIFGYVDMRGSC